MLSTFVPNWSYQVTLKLNTCLNTNANRTVKGSLVNNSEGIETILIPHDTLL